MRDMGIISHSKHHWLLKTVLLLLLLCTFLSAVTVVSAESDLKALLDPLTRESFPDKNSELAKTVRQAYLEDPAAFAAVSTQYDISKARYFQDLICPDKREDPEGFATVLEATERLATVSMPEAHKRFAFELLLDLWFQKIPTNDMASVNYEQCVEACRFSDGAYATLIFGVCSELLMEDPVKLIRTLAKLEDLEQRYRIGAGIAYEAQLDHPVAEAFAVLENADLNGAERVLAQYMHDYAAGCPDNKPEVPQTADGARGGLLIAVVMGAVSILACGALWINRKRFL
jgi:hypothetical protein